MWSAGVQPLGNLLYEAGGLCAGIAARSRALGALHVLSDQLICRVLTHVSAADLASFSELSSACRAFAIDDDLWRRACLGEYGARALHRFQQSWRFTYSCLRDPRFRRVQHSQPVLAPFYSDILFHKLRCLHARVQDSWLSHDNCVRVSARSTDRSVFLAHFERGSVPCVIKDAAARWPAVTRWELRSLIDTCGDVAFDVAGMQVPLREYLVYAFRVCNHDDQSFVLFDPRFADKAPQLAADFSVPPYFRDDLFDALGDARPDHRWLIIGPERSGSVFHKDPNCTSAWNAVVMGRKKWLLFPPHAPPPGVTPSTDGGDVRAPLSVMEWFINFYEAAREYGRTVGAIECVVNTGEVMFIPAGWWHIVLNLEFTIAVTQNYASPVHAVRIAKWLREHPDQISGVRSRKQAAYIAKHFPRLVAHSRHGLVHGLAAAGVLAEDEMPRDVAPRNGTASNTDGEACNVGDDTGDCAHMSGTTQVIRYDDSVRASAAAATDSSSADEVVLSPVVDSGGAEDKVAVHTAEGDGEECGEEERKDSGAKRYRRGGGEEEKSEVEKRPAVKKSKTGMWGKLKTGDIEKDEKVEVKTGSFAFNFKNS